MKGLERLVVGLCELEGATDRALYVAKAAGRNQVHTA